MRGRGWIWTFGDDPVKVLSERFDPRVSTLSNGIWMRQTLEEASIFSCLSHAVVAYKDMD